MGEPRDSSSSRKAVGKKCAQPGTSWGCSLTPRSRMRPMGRELHSPDVQ